MLQQRIHCFRRIFPLCRLQRNYSYKKKWAKHNKEKEYKDLALEHFDQYHSQTYDKLWPSIRLALLSQQKYCAVVNNYAIDTDNICVDLITQGSENIIQKGINIHQSLSETVERVSGSDILGIGKLQDFEANESLNTSSHASKDDLLEDYFEDDRTDLHRFVPTEKVYTKAELFMMEEHQQNISEDTSFDVKVVPDKNFRLPNRLKVFTQPMGEVALFPPPRSDDSGKLDYYLLDAASILPVVTLNIQPEDSVLDLCAAPGGKALAMFQTLLPGSVVCNDLSWSRLQRLKSIVKSYLPESVLEENELLLTQKDARTYQFGQQFDKVLVDVPCLTDRHCLHENDNNIFKPGRTAERMGITKTQRDLLVTGIQACSPGGSIVYSTCTLTMPQNDGVIQAALEYIWENTNIDVVVQDTSILTTLFKDTFRFHDGCRYGQLVLPNIQANFGPMYICKLLRIK